MANRKRAGKKSKGAGLDPREEQKNQAQDKRHPCHHSGAKKVSDSEKVRLLTTWNQLASRNFVRQTLCFSMKELDDFAIGVLCTHIKRCLSLACSQFPHFAGKIRLGQTDGKVYISTTEKDVVPFQCFDHRRDEKFLFGWSYPELKAQDFQCKAFVGPEYDLPYDLAGDGPGVPALEVHARVIRGGGLLLTFFMHHSITDGMGMRNFISTFAKFTRSDDKHVENGIENESPRALRLRRRRQRRRAEPVRGSIHRGGRPAGFKNGVENGQVNKLEYPADIDVDIPDKKTAALLEVSSFNELMDQCPEYKLLPLPTGPTAPCTRREWELSLGDVPKTGRIVTFSQENISALKALAKKWTGDDVSTFACLAGVTFLFSTVSRRAAHPTSQTKEAHLIVPVWWKNRAFQGELTGYAGNAVALVRISASLENDVTDELLGRLIGSINSGLKSGVDDDFVLKRTAMFRAVPDTRLVGLNLDPQDPRDFIFNSWRHLGADIGFQLPGMEEPEGESGLCGRTPDAVRRAQPQWNMGAGLLLPGKKDEDNKVVLTLDDRSMMHLLRNKEWNKWIDQTIE